MDQGYGGLEEDGLMKPRKFWGLRPWKRHSTILMVVGFLFVLVGMQYALAPESKGRSEALYVILQVAPIQFWGGVFIFAGFMSMISSRWPPLAETWGYMVLTGLSSGWSATYLIGIIFFKSPAANITQVILWGSLGFMWWAISGLPNPERPAVEE